MRLAGRRPAVRVEMERGGRAHDVFLVADLTELAYELGVEAEGMRGIEDGI